MRTFQQINKNYR